MSHQLLTREAYEAAYKRSVEDPEGFWDSTRDIIQEHFRKGHFKEGIIEGVLSAGKELQAHFPWHPEDPNELTDEISRS